MKLRHLAHNSARTRRVMPLPIPHVQASAREGEVVLDENGIGDFPNDAARWLLENCPGAFEAVEDAPAPAPAKVAAAPEPAVSPLEEDDPTRVFAKKPEAVTARNRHFPGAEIVERPDGRFAIVGP